MAAGVCLMNRRSKASFVRTASSNRKRLSTNANNKIARTTTQNRIAGVLNIILPWRLRGGAFLARFYTWIDVSTTCGSSNANGVSVDYTYDQKTSLQSYGGNS